MYGEGKSIFYAPEAHIMYVPYSCVLISHNKFCNGGEPPEQGKQVPLCTCSSTPLSRGPETSLVALVHKTTYAPMIYTALCIMFWMHAYSIYYLCKWEGVGPGILKFFGPKMALDYRLDAIS